LPNEKNGEQEVAIDAAKSSIYTKDGLKGELRQGEVISGLLQYIYDQSKNDVDAREHPYAVVLTQDCDLLWDYELRQKGDSGKLSSVLLYEADIAEEVRKDHDIKSDLWRRIIKNNDERWHLLEKSSQQCDAVGHGIGSLIIDFKQFFTLTPDDIYRQVAAGTARRRCRLEVPYREHLQCRAAFYFQRVTLPFPHSYTAASPPIA